LAKRVEDQPLQPKRVEDGSRESNVTGEHLNKWH
jgi:hypothetical protein